MAKFANSNLGPRIPLIRIIACALTLLALSVNSAHADKRVALVIGNSAYKFAGELPNPRNDSADMARALRQVGFQVIDGLDLDKTCLLYTSPSPRDS